ncbi:MAG: hypothetical protein AB7F35_29605 [Acetobacteraceae bacterium]
MPRPTGLGSRRTQGSTLCAFAIVILLAWGLPARAASLSLKDMQVLSRALGFVQPGLASGTVAIAYSAADPASKRDAQEIAALILGGLRVGGVVLTPEIVEDTVLGGRRFVVLIAAAGAGREAIQTASRNARALCISADMEMVRSGHCAMGIKSAPRVEIVVNHDAVKASGIEFAAAFRMMIKEI